MSANDLCISHLGEPVALDQTSKHHFDELAKQLGSDLKSVVVFKNHCTDVRGRPRGFIASVVSGATHYEDALLHDDMFETLILTRVTSNKELDPKQARTNLDKAIGVAQGMAPTLERCGTTAQDNSSWEPALAGDRAFAGLVRFQGDVWGSPLYVAVRSSIPQIVSELRQKASKENLTIDQLVQTPEFHKARDLALRNAERLAWKVVRSQGLDVSRVAQDVSAWADEHTTKPLRVLSESQRLSDIQQVATSDNYAFYNDAVKPHVTTAAEPKLFVVQGPRDGIIQYSLGRAAPVGVPCTTQIIRRPNKLTATAHAKEAELQRKSFIFPGQASQAFHPALLPGAYAKADAQFSEQLRQLDVPNVVDVRRFTPVLLKLASPK